ncbi:hypothetical protein [Streptomyces sp. WAC01526]|uniref:hypothetical protein n=1 Tax=Streptomyces sp. WAC01526 TaxID=2588709 RepID=UPI0021CD17FC|nr:hypothetical protein [Streptomyces sp. WAC01526]
MTEQLVEAVHAGAGAAIRGLALLLPRQRLDEGPLLRPAASLWPMVKRLTHATAVTRRASGGKTISARLAR